ncbi:MAG: hypothetical protein AVDCRST_MAG71-2137 [uncultured Lysobacter sp.]|uniref:Uncharacterized protein n=1 Tax=uncultured Lysobacter sp. TaxID=271060 RepID=A0A6J4LQJ7_9GAMM|nr:MAG: hypothetical protein AVDCRST_MAG71-2137 [uncultured Lysobacter sp.]
MQHRWMRCAVPGPGLRSPARARYDDGRACGFRGSQVRQPRRAPATAPRSGNRAARLAA